MVALFAERLPVTWARGVALLVPLIGIAAAAFAFAPNRSASPPGTRFTTRVRLRIMNLPAGPLGIPGTAGTTSVRLRSAL